MPPCCGTQWDTKAYKKHITTDPSHIFVCGACCIAFGVRKHFQRHMRRRHKSGNVYSHLQTNSSAYCGTCWRQFDSDSDYNRHHRKAHDGWCFICEKDFGASGALEQHDNYPVHLKPTIQCPQYPKCKRLFKTTGGVAAHLESGSCNPITRELVAEAVRRWDKDNLITRALPSTNLIRDGGVLAELHTEANEDKESVISEATIDEHSSDHLHDDVVSSDSTSQHPGPISPETDSDGPEDLAAMLSDSEVVISDYASSEIFLSDLSISDFELVEPGALSPTYSAISDGELVVLVSHDIISGASTPSAISSRLSLARRTSDAAPSLHFPDHFVLPPLPPVFNLFHCPKCKRNFGFISSLVQHIESGSCGLASLGTVQEIYQGLAEQFKYLLTV